MSLLRSFTTVGGYTLLSRLTGFARDMLIASMLGAGMVADAYFVAFKFPNLFRRLFAEGAFSAAFVPMFSATLEKDGEEAAKEFANRCYAFLALVVALFSAVLMIGMPWTMYVFAPGFTDVPGKHELATELSRICFPYLFFISLCSLVAGVLNSLGRFAAAAGTPILLNLVSMAALAGLSRYTETPGHALAWGTAAAGVAQFVWLMAAAKQAGFLPRLIRPRLDDQVKTLLKRIVPVAFGAGMYQISLLIDTMLASMVSDGAVSYLYFADRVNQLPLGVVGIAVGTALLPILSRQIAAGDVKGASDSQNRSLEFSLLLTLPAMAGLIVLAEPIIRVLFQRGAFSAEDAQATAAALMAFSVGLPSYVLVKVFTPGFFAREDTRTPVRIALVCLVFNVVLNVALMQVLAHVGIALATALASVLNATLLATTLIRRGHYRWDERLKSRLPRILGATLAMTAVLLAGRWLAEGRVPDTSVAQALLLTGLVLAGGIVFAGMAVLTGAVRRSDLAQFKGLRRRPAGAKAGSDPSAGGEG